MHHRLSVGSTQSMKEIKKDLHKAKGH